MNILEKFLKKIGVSSYTDLTSEEKETYKAWEVSLTGRRLTDEEVRSFLERELNEAVLRVTEVDLPKEAEIFRKVEIRMINKILTFLDMPKMEKALIEKQLAAQI